MKTVFLIRAIIFLIPGLLMIFYPGKVFKYQALTLRKLNITYDPNQNLKSYPSIGIFFVIIAIGLFVYSIVG